ncbi:MAG: trypsin-like peptidase domain-containing protein [Chloroflexi bacterium]|nr:trypsin-like peptidase domain-containing protein [Chloroflexota bacterium]
MLAYDANHDIAALRVDADNLPLIKIGDSRALRAGEMVFAVGHPWGILGAVTFGIVIGAGAQLPEMMRGRELIAVNLRYRPGYSGGPLLNAEGQMIGINTLMTGPEVGAAVPVHLVKKFLGELRENARIEKPRVAIAV